MSADRQRLKSAIQRIAKEDPEIRNLLGEGQNKGGKPGSAGVGTSEAEESRLCCDGSTSDNANPGTGERDPDAESQDGLDSDDPAKLSSGDGTLSGVTDCETGEPICFDGSGFIPPEGWGEPNEPPPESSYEDGFYWAAAQGEEGSWAPTALTSCQKIRSDAAGYCLVDDTHALCQTQDQVDSGDCLGFGSTYKWACSGESVCDEEPIRAESWPEDGCTNLAIINGSIVGSKYDPENDGSYSAPRSEIELCDDNGNKIKLTASADGGWKTLNSTEDNGYLYDSSGTQIAHIDGNEYSDPSI